MLLPDKLVQRPRPHAIGQRPGAIGRFTARDGLEKTHKAFHHRDTEKNKDSWTLVQTALRAKMPGMLIHFRFLCLCDSVVVLFSAAQPHTARCSPPRLHSAIPRSRVRDGHSLIHLGQQVARHACAFASDEDRQRPGQLALGRATCPCAKKSRSAAIPSRASARALPTSLACAMGNRNTDPAEARTTFELNGLTVPSPSKTPAAPNASADRRMVPRFPGSCTPAIATRGPAVRPVKTSAAVNVLQRTKAATPCGVSLGTALANNLSGSNKSFDMRRQLRQQAAPPDSPPSSQKHCPKLQSAANGLFEDPHAFDGAISVGRQLAMRRRPARSSLTRALWRPSMRRKRPWI